MTIDITEDLVGLGHLIAGRIVDSPKTFDVTDPATGEVVASCPAATNEQLDEAMLAARGALAGWARSEQARRASLLAMAEALEGAADPIGRVLARESGKPAFIARGEVMGSAAHARWYAEQPLTTDTVVDDGEERIQVIREPVGVVAAITPWNAPVMMLVNKLAAAMLAGDTVVAKPSPFTPLSSLLVARTLAGVVPEGVINVLAGDDDIGKAMATHPETDLIAFTGSVSAGKSIMAAAAPGLKRLLLELGGNDAAIVLADANPAEVAAELFRGAFGLSGQICAAIKRLYVHESIHDEIVEQLAQLARAAVLGGPFDEGVTMGPLTTRPQFDRVAELIEDALAAGGVAVSGGAPLDRPGYFIPPTIVTGLSRGVRLVDEEQFGPALPVMPFKDVDEVIAEANDTAFGLGGSVWTANVDEGLRVASQLRCGTVGVNRRPAVGAAIPFGGVKESGIGREGGAVGVDAFCELKTVSVALE